MDKSLSQITFEFFGQQQDEEAKPVLPQQPNLQQNHLPPPDQKPKPTRGRKALKDFEAASEQVESPEDEVLFQTQYYSIGEV
jgi:hypothetical protein